MGVALFYFRPKGDRIMTQIKLHPEQQYLTDREVSVITKRGLQTLRNDRFKGQGVPYTKFGRLVRYRLTDVLEYLERHKIQTAECGNGDER
jgi:hypothetical protein